MGPRQLSSALFLLIVFEILFGFLRSGGGFPFPDVRVWNILLIQCYCVLILYLQNTLFKKSAMKQELDILNQLWHQQKEQYELSQETITLINRKCHDLKHQIAAMRAITSPEERDKYLREVEDSVQIDLVRIFPSYGNAETGIVTYSKISDSDGGFITGAALYALNTCLFGDKYLFDIEQ